MRWRDHACSRLVLLAASSCCAGGRALEAQSTATTGTTVVLVRHAEKVDDSLRIPPSERRGMRARGRFAALRPTPA
jgi:hypothetical protein